MKQDVTCGVGVAQMGQLLSKFVGYGPACLDARNVDALFEHSASEGDVDGNLPRTSGDQVIHTWVHDARRERV